MHWFILSPFSLPSSQATFIIVLILLLLFPCRYDAACIWGKEHENNPCGASDPTWDLWACQLWLWQSKEQPFLSAAHSVAQGGFICPICCLTQVQELAAKKEIPFSLLCSFTVAASGLQRVSDTRRTFTFPSLHFFPLCQLWMRWGIKPVTEWAASSFFLAEIQRISCC